jgi:crossover junction endodeoxyribonuclease RusA
MGMAYSLCLPMPPSTNHYWGVSGHRRFLTAKALLFRQIVAARCLDARVEPLQGRISVMCWLNPPDKRVRDLDNFCGKALLDALKHGGMYRDDSQIDHLEARRGKVTKGGGVDVIVCEMGMIHGIS